MTEWRLKAYRHWLTMSEPTWVFVSDQLIVHVEDLQTSIQPVGFMDY